MIVHARLLVICSAVSILACSKPSATSPPALTPSLSAEKSKDPSKIIEAFEKTLKDLAAYGCKLEMVIHLKANGMDNRMVSDYSINIQKPNRWAIVLESGVMGGTSVSDGSRVTNYLPMLQRYSVEDFPEDGLTSMNAAGPAQAMGLMGPGAFASFFLGEGIAEWMLEGVTKSEHLGSESIDEVECEHFRFFQGEEMQWDLWVEVGEQLLVRRFAMQPDVSQAGEAMQGMSMSVELSLDNWNTSAKFSDDDFVFDPPEGANKVDELLGGLDGPSEAPLHVLIGEDAPAFELPLLNGEKFALSEHLGEKVIVLDFWATWCGPCTAALPGLAKIAKELEGEEVAIYAVNQGEEADAVQEFLTKEELELQVLLDTEGTIGEMYSVEGIPMTAIIGKDKRVHVVHVGYSGGMEKKLKSEIEQLLAGEDLAANAKSQTQQRENAGSAEVEEKGTTELRTPKGS